MKELTNLTLKEHTDLKRSGLMWVVFPDATGRFKDDCKPEPPEPLIVKNGETLVAYWKGVDYLCMKPSDYHGKDICVFRADLESGFRKLIGYWKSFTGPNPDIVELTDELAKLRPMIKDGKQFRVLLAIWNNCVKTDGYSFDMNQKTPKLATAKELQDTQK